MANATHGKRSRLYFETTPGAATKPPLLAATGYTKLDGAYSVRNQLAKDLADSSAFGQDEHTNEVGLKGGSLSFDVRYTSTLFPVLLSAYNTETPVSVVFRPEGDVSGKYQMFADYHVESIEVSASIGDVVGGTVSLRRNGSITYAPIA